VVVEQIHAHEAQAKVNEEIAKNEKKKQDKIDKQNTPKKGTKSNQVKKGKKRQKTHR